MKAPYPRTRYRDQLRKFGILVEYFNDFEPVDKFGNYTTYNGAPEGFTEVMKDVVTPGFTFISEQGGVVNTVMSRRKVETKYVDSVINWAAHSPPVLVSAGNWFRFTGKNFSEVDTDPLNTLNFAHFEGDIVDINKLKKLAAIQARNKINPVLVQSLVSVAELHKSVELVGQTGKSFAQLIAGVVTGNPKLIAKALSGQRSTKNQTKLQTLAKTAEQRWLQYRYGWIPLIMEVQGAVKALRNVRPELLRFTSRGKSSDYRKSAVAYVGGMGASGKLDFTFDIDQKVEVRAFCFYKADLEYQSARDFGITELPLAAWELVPYSFVIDWFIQVGDWLEAVTPKLGITILTEGLVVRSRMILNRVPSTYTPPPLPSNNTQWLASGYQTTPDTRIIDKIDREVGLGILASPPPLNIKLNVKRVVDAIALLKASNSLKPLRI